MQKSFVDEAARHLQLHLTEEPRVGIVLGTGLNAFIQEMKVSQTVPYDSIPHFPVSTVEFHKGQLVFGAVDGVPVVVMQGRFHYYEGYAMQQISFPVRVMKELGVQALFLSNAAGGMNPAFRKGDLVLVEDHINLLPDNPLRGLGSEWGNRFVDMSEPYAPALRSVLQEAAAAENFSLQSGTYVAVMGPNLETKAEYRWLRSTGADMVGMSTVPEVIVAAHIGLPCAAVSVITDECDPNHLQPVNIAEIIAIAGEADKKLAKIFRRAVAAMGNGHLTNAG